MKLMPTYMREALDAGATGHRAGHARIPMVGAVIVQDGEVVGRGFHTWEGLKHAEILALEEAGERARGATIYVTLEPCSHTGRTPPCADALIAAGIAKVVAASADPNPLVAGEGFRRLRASGVQVEIATEFQAEAEKLNEPFFHFMRTGRPLVTLKSALTLDGKIAAPEDNTGWITSERARAHVQELRHASDAIITGIGTVLADDPAIDRPQRICRARGRCCAWCSIPRCACRSNRGWCRARRTICSSPPHPPHRRNAGARSKIAASKCKIFDGPRGQRRHPRRDRAARRTPLPVGDDRGRQQGELGGARIGRRGQGVPLLRAEDSRRLAVAADGGRHRPHAPRRCDSAGTHHAASDPAR